VHRGQSLLRRVNELVEPGIEPVKVRLLDGNLGALVAHR